jgi:hypothetical protein
MAYTTTGLSNHGRTNYFNFQYDASLSKARGQDLAADLMQYCDDDLALVASWFPGRRLDMSPPIQVSLANPTTAQGASWFGFGALPLQITIGMGEVAMTMGTPTMLARYLLVSEVSEMYMRAFSPYLFNPWFGTGEGSKGEGLSRFLGVQFLLKEYPGVAAIPGQVNAPFNVSNIWLNSARDNNIDTSADDSAADAITGCATLFLFFLHDQLGFRIEHIINAGAGSLSNVYQNLTQDSWQHAWGKFRPLVDAHCPTTVQADGTVPQYFPQLDTIFPVSDLSLLTAPGEVSWVIDSSSPGVGVLVDHPAQIRFNIGLTSDDATIIPSFAVTIEGLASGASTALPVLPQSAAFTSKMVTLTARYAGKSLSTTIKVVRPEQLRLPPLEITVDSSADRCEPSLVESTSQTFAIKSLGVLANQIGLAYSWSVTGATGGAGNAATFTVSNLPVAGTIVTVTVTVRNAQNLQASGTFAFQTVGARTGLDALQEELRCRLDGFRNGSLSIPPWIPIEKAETLHEQLALVEKQLHQVTDAATRLNAIIKSIKEFEDLR